MNRFRRVLVPLGVITLLVAMIPLCLVVVDETEFVVMTRFGRVVAVYGDDPGEAGPHFKAPWEVPVRLDRRVHVFDPPAREVITGDKRNLDVASYVVWKVADPVVFLRATGSIELAEARLEERVSAALSDAIGRRELAAIASTDSSRWSLDDLTGEVTGALAPTARAELGVAVIDVRLRRFSHPLEVRPAVFDLIRSERRQVAARLRAEGDAQFIAITSAAERAADAILAQAEAEAKRIQGNAEAEATRMLNEAHARDPKFFEFLRTLETYGSILDEQATLVLSSSSPLLKLLSQGPPADGRTEAPAAATAVNTKTARQP
jgi:membrane protease subunit HflC